MYAFIFGDPLLVKSWGAQATYYCDVIMSAMAAQITSLVIVYLTVYSGANKKSFQASRHWPLWGEFTGSRGNPRTKGQ